MKEIEKKEKYKIGRVYKMTVTRTNVKYRELWLYLGDWDWLLPNGKRFNESPESWDARRFWK